MEHRCPWFWQDERQSPHSQNFALRHYYKHGNRTMTWMFLRGRFSHALSDKGIFEFSSIAKSDEALSTLLEAYFWMMNKNLLTVSSAIFISHIIQIDSYIIILGLSEMKGGKL